MKAHVEKSKKYELDKFLINKIYKIQEKPKRIYHLNKKNVVYDKELTEQYNKFSNSNNINYYSSYQNFRDFFSSGYNYDFLTNEINNVKSILGFSREMREIISKRCNPDPIQKISNEVISENDEKKDTGHLLTALRNPIIPKNNNNKEVEVQNPLFKKDVFKRVSVVFNIDKTNPNIMRITNMSHNTFLANKAKKKNLGENFIDFCKLLKLKNEELKNPINQYQFRL